MSNPLYPYTMITAQSDGAALTNSVTATSILPTAAIYTIPNNWLSIGTRLKIWAMGRISTVVTTPGTLTFSVRLGTGPVIAATSDAINLNTTAKTNVAWFLEWDLTCRAIGGGTSANLMHNGKWTSEAGIASAAPTAGGVATFPLVASAPAVGTGFDSTAAQKVDLFAAFSVANASNSIQLHDYALVNWN